MARIAVGGLHHETNSFAPQRATFERFEEADGWPPLSRGDALIANTAGVNLAVAGFIEAALVQHELVPMSWANACPSGPVTRDAFERLAAMLVDDLRAAMPVDGIFLDLHGAMVCEHLEDGEGELLRRLRAVAPDGPLVAALDLHANVSVEMVERADVLVAYRTYPHVDLAVTGARCLPLLEQRMGGRRFAKAHRRIDYLIPLPWQCTDLEPARSLYASLAELEADGLASASICTGFPAADTPVCGPSVLAYAEDEAVVAAAADRLAQGFADAEARFVGRLWTPDEAVAHALALAGRRPIILADTQDNPGGGGSSDTTDLLAALIAADAPSAVLALIADGDLAGRAHTAGEGGVLVAQPLGGRHGPVGVTPLVEDWEVVRLGDGRFTATGPMYAGSTMDLGPMALLRPRRTPGVEVAVSTRRVQAADQEILRHLGVEPATRGILALKSSVHFRADFAPLASEILIVRAPGACVADPSELPFTRLPGWMRLRPRA
jgi:microcystin degradation protein MlrC